jgi:succinate-semialdehyde dehydrogenase/glutarate-semialdehyde dehydrogenase
VANFGEYGLGSSVFSKDRGDWATERIRSGIGFINAVPTSNERFPTGGVGKSGYGRESELQGYLQFANIKTFFKN